MDDTQKINTLLASAASLMSDASVKLASDDVEVAASIKLLRDVGHDLRIIADLTGVIDRKRRLSLLTQ